jgi:hypothetical protein
MFAALLRLSEALSEEEKEERVQGLFFITSFYYL